MEQIFMIEIFVEKLILKIVPPPKTPSELKLAEEKRIARELAEAAEAAKKGKGKGKAKKEKKGKKGKGKAPVQSKEEELRFLQTCTVQMRCLPLFDFYIAHDNFVEPPPPPPPAAKGKKGKKKPKPKKGKGKKGPPTRKIALPSEPIPDLPYLNCGNVIMFLSRPSKLEEIMKFTPISVNVWNREEDMNCIGFVIIEWDDSFFKTVSRAAELNPVILDGENIRDTSKPEMVSVTMEFHKVLQCEEDLKLSGEITFYVRLSALGNRVVSNFVTLPEIPLVPGRAYLTDEYKSKDIEAVRNWQGSSIDDLPPVAYLFGAPDINRAPKASPHEIHRVYSGNFVAPYTNSELNILAMGFPKGPCGGTNCLKRLDTRTSEYTFVYGEYVKGKYKHGQFVNTRDVHGPCGRLDCPLAKKIRTYLNGEGACKPCHKPCCKSYY